MALAHFSYSLENVRDGVCPSVFGVEGRFGSITRSAKLYSTTLRFSGGWR
jgi:hypothetical protein